MTIATLGEILLRLTPPGRQRLIQTQRLEVQYGGGEANVAAALVRFGHRVKFLTSVPKTPLGQSALGRLRAEGIDTRACVRGEGRMGIYFVEEGQGPRGPKVHYDRKSSAFALSKVEDYAIDEFLDGVSYLYLSGVTPALGASTRDLVLIIAERAVERGIPIGVDINYRSKLWTPEEAANFMERLLPMADLVIGLPFFTDDMLWTHGSDLDDRCHLSLCRQVAARYGVRYVVKTLREVISASEHTYGALLYDSERDELYRETSRPLDVVDRIGGGDAFAAGLVHGLCSGLTSQEALAFAVSTSHLKHTIPGDMNLVCIPEIKRLLGGDRSGRIDC